MYIRSFCASSAAEGMGKRKGFSFSFGGYTPPHLDPQKKEEVVQWDLEILREKRSLGRGRRERRFDPIPKIIIKFMPIILLFSLRAF
jgi:hypothetical protein